jgi:hypothetical protein
MGCCFTSKTGDADADMFVCNATPDRDTRGVAFVVGIGANEPATRQTGALGARSILP